MARIARVVVFSCPNHVTQRGVRSVSTFSRDKIVEHISTTLPLRQATWKRIREWLCRVISSARRKFRIEYLGQNTTDIRCRQDAGELFVMKNDGGPEMTLCHLKSDLVQGRVEGNDIRLIKHYVAGSEMSLIYIRQERSEERRVGKEWRARWAREL